MHVPRPRPSNGTSPGQTQLGRTSPDASSTRTTQHFESPLLCQVLLKRRPSEKSRVDDGPVKEDPNSPFRAISRQSTDFYGAARRGTHERARRAPHGPRLKTVSAALRDWRPDAPRQRVHVHGRPWGLFKPKPNGQRAAHGPPKSAQVSATLARRSPDGRLVI